MVQAKRGHAYGNTRRPIISRSWFNADKSELWLFQERVPFLFAMEPVFCLGLRLSQKFYPEEIYHAAALFSLLSPLSFVCFSRSVIESWILIGILLGDRMDRLFRATIILALEKFLSTFHLFVCLFVYY